MRHLILFEKFGVNDNVVTQSHEYFKEISDSPNINKFNFLFQNEVGNFFFDLEISPKLKPEGELETEVDPEGRAVKYTIRIRSRDDIDTLVHEVKHLDYGTRNKNLFKAMYKKANMVLNSYPDAPATLVEIFYSFDVNEFQSKYHQYATGFDSYVKKNLKPGDTKVAVSRMLSEFLISNDDMTWVWYMTPGEFKFENHVSKNKLDACFYDMLESGVKNQTDLFKWGKNQLINNIKMIINNIRKRSGIWTKQERVEIDKIKGYFENEIQKRKVKFRRKFTRLIPMVMDKYNIK